ncbi:deoxyribodipyrimidine photo-lyase [Meridianimaribacter sp. CL38]|uniref:cryptochrome/photolyase family protein n=1 Tax=Meridianimaribacter sp. CL38 TaxID=2213021 RepID=UPI00351A0067
MKEKVTLFWFRRDLRFEDNHALWKAQQSEYPVLPVFIFDTNIIEELDEADSRVTFIHNLLTQLSNSLKSHSKSLYCKVEDPIKVWEEIVNTFDVQTVFANEDYEPYAITRDKNVKQLLAKHDVNFTLLKDQVIFEKNEVLKADNTPYTVYTPYKNKWLENFNTKHLNSYASNSETNFLDSDFKLPSLSELGFKRSSITVKDYDLESLEDYKKVRDFPALDQTSHLSPHLRFGTISIRKVIKKTLKHQAFLNELIWREFFMQILFHFPKVVDSNFKSKYDNIKWRNNTEEFEKWKKGQTGYPMVDAGMRELNATGYMHNRVRMIVAGFLCKHLLIDWKWGEAYFAEKLLDYELSSNNGNWQWAAGTGCDAAPYFRVFNPTTQIKKFDPKLTYINSWIPELNSLEYPTPMVEHKDARERAIETYKVGLNNT